MFKKESDGCFVLWLYGYFGIAVNFQKDSIGFWILGVSIYFPSGRQWHTQLQRGGSLIHLIRRTVPW